MDQSTDRRMGKKVQFFKILIGNFSKRLRIPPKVVNFLSDKTYKRAVLQGPTGCIWHIKLGKATKGWYIMDGWTEFVNDHSLKESDLLFFKYDGITHFKVKIFDQSACEKDILSSKVQNEGKRKRERPTKHQAEIGGHACDDDSLGGDDVSLGNACQESKYSKGSKKQRCSSKNSLEYGCVYEHEACINGLLQGKCMPSTHSPTKTGKCSPPPTPSPKGPAKCMPPSSTSTKGVQIVEIKTELHDQPIYSSKSHVKSDEASLSKMEPSIEEKKERLSNAVRSVASTFPYFTKFMTKSNLFDSQVVRIPTRFVEYLPLQKAKMVLRDPTGWPWTVNYIRGNDNILSGGWTAFMRNNNLEVGDLCLFELIKPLELKVYIFKHSK